eukprot:gene30361-39594_t
MSSLSEDAKQTLKRLLDKAGNDPRLTPRILREKAEQKLHLETGELKRFRETIKTIIIEWWLKDNKARSAPTIDQKSSVDETEWRALRSLANSSGNSSCLKDLPDSIKQKNKLLRERLRKIGLKFSDVPTSAEISRAKRDYEIQMDVINLRDGMAEDDPPMKKKRSAAEHANAVITGTGSSSHTTEPKPLAKPYYEDEESEF